MSEPVVPPHVWWRPSEDAGPEICMWCGRINDPAQPVDGPDKPCVPLAERKFSFFDAVAANLDEMLPEADQ